jgi:hypothetical protein
LLFELLDLTTLLLECPLLLVDLGLRLFLSVLLILHFVSDQETAARAERTADRGARSWRPDRRANYRTGSGSYQGADSRALFAVESGCPEHPITASAMTTANPHTIVFVVDILIVRVLPGPLEIVGG